MFRKYNNREKHSKTDDFLVNQKMFTKTFVMIYGNSMHSICYSDFTENIG